MPYEVEDKIGVDMLIVVDTLDDHAFVASLPWPCSPDFFDVDGFSVMV